MEPEGTQGRGRLIFAGSLAAALVVAIVIVIASSGNEAASVQAADPECVAAWNDDEAIVSTGVHLFQAHRYETVEVTRVGRDGGPLAEGEQGLCAVVFAAQTLDPEQVAAAQALTQEVWVPLSSLPAVTSIRLGELQAHAVGAANATLDEAGMLAASE